MYKIQRINKTIGYFFGIMQNPVKLTTLDRFKLTTSDRLKLTISDRSKLTT